MLRNKTSGAVYLVVVFSLFLREDVGEDGKLKEGAQQHRAGGAGTAAADTTAAAAQAEDEHEHDEEAAMQKARDELGVPHNETNDDDVD